MTDIKENVLSTTRLSTKLNVGDVANPLDALKAANVADTDTKTVIMLGQIIGVASGLSYRSNNFGDTPSVALTGVFEAVPFDPSLPTTRSPSLFMPRAVQDMLVTAMLDGGEHAVTAMPKKGTKLDVPGKKMDILFEVGVKRNAATGGAGYEFVVEQVGRVQTVDVLEELKARSGITTGQRSAGALARPTPAPQLAPPKADNDAAAKKAPAKKAAGGKRR